MWQCEALTARHRYDVCSVTVRLILELIDKESGPLSTPVPLAKPALCQNRDSGTQAGRST